MLPKTASDIPPSEITPQSVYLSRRKFLACGSAAAAGLAIGPTLLELLSPLQKVQTGTKLNAPIKSPFSTNEKQTSYNDVTHYNNFYSRHHSGAKCYFHCRMDSTVGRQTLADAASPGIRECHRRHRALLLAGQVGHSQTGVLRHDAGPITALPNWRMARAQASTTTSQRLRDKATHLGRRALSSCPAPRKL